MERVLRPLMRIMMVLLILVGVVLVVHSVRIDTRGEPSPGPDEGQATPPSGDDKQLVEVKDFDHTDRDEEREVTIQGPEATVDIEGKIYHVIKPVLLVKFTTGGEVQVDHRDVRMTASKAVWDDENGTVRLEGGVTVAGEDFEAQVDNVTYTMKPHRLSSEGDVLIQKFSGDPEHRQPVMETTGRGLTADLVLSKMTIESDVVTRLFRVSEEFLKAETEQPEPDKVTGNVVIRCDGRLVYEHKARKLSYHKNVRVESGAKTLSCGHCTIRMEEAGPDGRLHVSDMLAEGSVELKTPTQNARGRKLHWEDLRQTAELTGKPCVVEGEQFEITADKLSLYRLNARFQVDGPGTLHWVPPENEKPDEAPDEPPGAISPIDFNTNDPLRVQWQESMTRDAEGNTAAFKGDVIVTQKDSSLKCDALQISFDAETSGVSSITAEGAVRVRTPVGEVSRDVICGFLEWKAAENTVELRAKEGEQLTITQGRQKIFSSHVVINNTEKSIESPVAGRLMVMDEGDDAAQDTAIVVAWKKAAHLTHGDKPVALFTGEVAARRQDKAIEADELQVDFDEDMNPILIRATGNAMVDVLSKPEEGAPEATEDAKEEATGGAVPPAPAATTTGRWRLASRQITLVPLKNLIIADTPGTLTRLENDVVTGTIEWKRAMRLDGTEKFALFEGDTVADMVDSQLKADELRLDFVDKDEPIRRELNHLSARGHVEFAAKHEQAWLMKADSAEVVLAPGSELRQVIARDNVQVIDQQRMLTARLLVVTFTKLEGQQDPVVSHAVADGDVHVAYTDAPKEAGGDRLEWDCEDDIYLLTGTPAWIKKDNLVSRNRIIRMHRPTGEEQRPPSPAPETP